VAVVDSLYTSAEEGGTRALRAFQIGWCLVCRIAGVSSNTEKHDDTAAQLMQLTSVSTVPIYTGCKLSDIDSCANVTHSVCSKRKLQFELKVLSIIFRTKVE
jgi:hypothetical protein